MTPEDVPCGDSDCVKRVHMFRGRFGTPRIGVRRESLRNLQIYNVLKVVLSSCCIPIIIGI